MSKKDEIIENLRETTDGLESTLYFLPETERPGSLGLRADLIETYAQDLLSAAQDLKNLAIAQQELQTAAQNVRKSS